MSSETRSTSVRLKGAELAMVLFQIGWTSERSAAEKCRMHRTQLRRCLDGQSTLDPQRSEWLLKLRDAHVANPCPVQPASDPILQALQLQRRADEKQECTIQ